MIDISGNEEGGKEEEDKDENGRAGNEDDDEDEIGSRLYAYATADTFDDFDRAVGPAADLDEDDEECAKFDDEKEAVEEAPCGANTGEAASGCRGGLAIAWPEDGVGTLRSSCASSFGSVLSLPTSLLIFILAHASKLTPLFFACPFSIPVARCLSPPLVPLFLPAAVDASAGPSSHSSS